MEDVKTRPPRPAPIICPRCERMHDWTWREPIPWRGGEIRANG